MATDAETRAIRIHQTGGPEVLKEERVPLATLAPHEARLRHTAIGLNYIDTYLRSGALPLPLPGVLGQEAAGVVEAIGSDVTTVAVGDRVAYAGENGAYCERRNVNAARLVKIAEGIGDDVAAAAMLKGLTAHYLLHRTVRVQAGDTILVHAAAGGVGMILSQWAKHIGAKVIGTVGSDEKIDVARAAGCDHVIVTAREDFVVRTKEITAGRGVPVVYDGVGKDTFMSSLDCLAPRGFMVFFGAASGPVAPLDPMVLARKGSLFLTRPTLAHHISTRDELVAAANALFDVIKQGKVKIDVRQRFALADAAKAHEALQGRRTVGSTVLTP